jgi:hypothetical protein
MSLQISDAPVSRKIKNVSSALITANNILASTGLGDALIGYAKSFLEQKTKSKPSKRKQMSVNRVNFSSKNQVLSGSTRAFKSKLFTAPVSQIYSIPPAHIGFCGTADRLADRDPLGSLKLRGASLLDNTVSFYSATGSNFGHGVNAASSVIPDCAIRFMDILALDPRVENTARCYSFFKFRSLKLHYIPLVGTNSSGTITTAFFDDVSAAASYFTSPVTVTNNVAQAAALTSQWSNTSPVWGSHTTVFLDRGAKLYPCNAQSNEYMEIYQVSMAILSSGFQPISGTDPSNSTLYNIGQIFIEYEVDFYDPVWGFNATLESSLPIPERRKLRSDRFEKTLKGIKESRDQQNSMISHLVNTMETGYSPSMHSINSTPVENCHAFPSSMPFRR